MNSKKLSTTSRLHALQTSSRFSPGGQRILVAAGGGNPLNALLLEIDETLLARTLHFENEGGASLDLEVAGRRILRLAAATGVVGADSCLSVPALDESHLDDLRRIVEAFAAPGRGLRVVTTPFDRLGDSVSVGLPVARLADALAIDLTATAADQTDGFLQRMIGHIGDGLVAWTIRQANTDDRSAGPEEMITPLRNFLDEDFETLNAQLDRLSPAPADPVCTVLGADLVGSHNLLCVREDGAVLIGVMDGDSTSPVLAAWNAARS